MTQDFGRYLRQRREDRKLTRQAVADASGLSYAYLSQLESGKKSSPSLTALRQLAEGMGVAVEELAQRAGVPVAREAPSGRSTEGNIPSLDDHVDAWHANPQYQPQPVASMPAERLSSRPANPRDDDSDVAEVVPALRRLLSTYSPQARLAVLHQLQAEALSDLSTGL